MTDKELILEEEIKDYLRKQPIAARSQGTDFRLVPSPNDIAKHFFELGLKAKGNVLKPSDDMTIIFQSSTGFEIGRWENWKGEIPQKGDIIFDPSWETSAFKKSFINSHVTGRVLLSTTPNEVIIYLA